MISSMELRGEIKKQLDIRRWRYEDLAKAAGYATNTVVVYMSNAPKQSDAFEQMARSVLGIKSV